MHGLAVKNLKVCLPSLALKVVVQFLSTLSTFWLFWISNIVHYLNFEEKYYLFIWKSLNFQLFPLFLPRWSNQTRQLRRLRLRNITKIAMFWFVFKLRKDCMYDQTSSFLMSKTLPSTWPGWVYCGGRAHSVSDLDFRCSNIPWSTFFKSHYAGTTRFRCELPVVPALCNQFLLKFCFKNTYRISKAHQFISNS